MKMLLIIPGGINPARPRANVPALVHLVDRLCKAHELVVVTLRQYPGRGVGQADGFRLYNLGTEGLLPGLVHRQRLQRLRQYLDGWEPDLVHGFWLGDSGYLAAKAARLFKAPLITSLGGGECTWIEEIRYGGWGKRGSRRATERALSQSCAVTAGSDYMVSRMPCTALKLPLGIDLELFQPAQNLPEGPPWRIIHVADINPVKQPHLVLDTARKLMDHGIPFHLDWVGVDTLNGAIQQKARDLGLEESLMFHGWIPNAELPGMYQKAHLYLQTSLHESQGVAVMEAAACGVPIIGTPVGLLSDLEPAAAKAVEPDAGAVAAEIEKLLQDPVRRGGQAKAARAVVSAYSVESTAECFEKLYEAAITAGPATRANPK